VFERALGLRAPEFVSSNIYFYFAETIGFLAMSVIFLLLCSREVCDLIYLALEDSI
jgi:hypothetical protein